jgi:cell division protein FtsW (lipid II flippase)
LSWKYLAAGATAAIPVFYFLIWRVPYRKARVEAFLDPWSDPAQKGFQVIQSMSSFHSGGLIWKFKTKGNEYFPKGEIQKRATSYNQIGCFWVQR